MKLTKSVFVGLSLLLAVPAWLAGAQRPQEPSATLFRESFDDARLLQRGWYDGSRFTVSEAEPFAGEGCIEYQWKAGGTTPVSSSGIRQLFEPAETVYLCCYIKLSEGWGWSGRAYHPHLMHFMTTENGSYAGPAATHLTVYVEPWNGKLRLAAQDIQNKDQPHGLTQGPLLGGYNGKLYDSEHALFTDNRWHRVEALFQLNSLDPKAEKPNADGVVRGWFDGKLVIERTDVVLRSTDFPKMKFNQFVLTPYFGPGLLPHAQTLWMDELTVGTERVAVIGAGKEVAAAPGRNVPADTHDYFPPPESQGGWRKLENPEDLRRVAGMDPAKLDELREWLLGSDDRNFAAVVIRHGYIALEVERGNSAKTDARRVASVSKAVCATVLAIASEQSRQGRAPRKMTFDDPAFEFIPWAQPLSDPRKARITVKQLLNHTSGICPEATGAPNDGAWEYILGHTGDPRTAKLAFDPGTGCGYSTHALAHAALVCETVTGKPYDQFAIEALFKPLGIEHWWFQFYDGGADVGRHPSHGLGMPARDLARIAYCMMHGGRWGAQQVIPAWFVQETAAPTHDVTTPEMRWKLNPRVFSHGWELPALHRVESGRTGEGIPGDARSKPGSGGQMVAFVPSLDLVITRQTGSSGDWEFEEYLRRTCAAVLIDQPEP